MTKYKIWIYNLYTKSYDIYDAESMDEVIDAIIWLQVHHEYVRVFDANYHFECDIKKIILQYGYIFIKLRANFNCTEFGKYPLAHYRNKKRLKSGKRRTIISRQTYRRYISIIKEQEKAKSFNVKYRDKARIVFIDMCSITRKRTIKSGWKSQKKKRQWMR